MGVPVTVDSDDLHTLLQATAAIKGIEAALSSAKHDPAVEYAKPHFTAASDNLATAYREATRRRDMPQLFREPSLHELGTLRALFFGDDDNDVVPFIRTAPIEWQPSYPRALVSIGLVELGNERDHIIWPDGRTTVVPGPPRVFGRLTPRGINALRKTDEQ